MENSDINTNAPQAQPAQGGTFQQQLPNATAILVLGILSIVICWCYGLVGLILGIIAIVLSNKAKDLYMANPEMYTTGSYNNMKAGRTMSIIGVCLSGIYLIAILIYLVILGAAFSFIPWEMYNNI
jgi:hypothetical protein